MNFFVVPREIRKIDKRGGGQNKLWGVCKNHEKNKHPPPFILNLRVSGHSLLRALLVMSSSLYFTRGQCNLYRTGVIWSKRLMLQISLAVVQCSILHPLAAVGEVGMAEGHTKDYCSSSIC